MILGKRSRDNLKGVHPKLADICLKAIAKGQMDFSVIQGVRTKEQQEALYAQGRTKPGPIVTWTKKSKHLIQPDGYGHAVDLAPFPIDWDDIGRFKELAALIKATARENGVRIECGADWQTPDYPHYQLGEKHD